MATTSIYPGAQIRSRINNRATRNVNRFVANQQFNPNPLALPQLGERQRGPFFSDNNRVAVHQVPIQNDVTRATPLNGNISNFKAFVPNNNFKSSVSKGSKVVKRKFKFKKQ